MTKEQAYEETEALQKELHESLAKSMDDIVNALQEDDIDRVSRTSP